jgi:hypothetical protein
MSAVVRYLAIVFDLAVLLVVVVVHRKMRVAATRWIVAALVCYVLGASSWFTVYFIAGLILPASSPVTAETHQMLVDVHSLLRQVFQILFAIFMAIGLILLIRARSSLSRPAPSQSLEPTADPRM